MCRAAGLGVSVAVERGVLFENPASSFAEKDFTLLVWRLAPSYHAPQ